MHYPSLSHHTLNVRVVPRTFRFKEPAGTSRGVYTERRVWYVAITAADTPALFGLGECAPLYDLSADYDAHYVERLQYHCRQLERTRQLDTESLRPYPSILMGLETALLSAAGSLCGDYRRLYDTPFSRGEEPLSINGLVWMGKKEEMLQRMEQKLEAGFHCVKLKIGAIDFEQEMELIRHLRQRFTAADVELRVDANGAFAPEEALQRLERLARYDIHSIEQPIRAGQWEAMTQLCRQSPLPIALDEELIGITETPRKAELLRVIRPHYLILKPTLHGGFLGAEEWMQLAATHDVPYWVTSALESNVGLNAIAQWTAATAKDVWERYAPQEGHRHALPTIHGLGTGQLFVENYADAALRISGEQLWDNRGKQRRFLAELHDFRTAWRDTTTDALCVHTSGSTGTPQPLHVQKWQMRASAMMTLHHLELRSGDTALLCMPLRYIAGKMMVVRAEVGQLRLFAVAPSTHPFSTLSFAPDFVAMTPQQVFETLRVPREAALLRRVRHLLIGGGAIHAELAQALRDFPHHVWSSYGMTETLSHIALRRLNGPHADEAYTPLKGVTIHTTEEGCLVISAPALGITQLVTNDLCELHPDGRFHILGRRDNVVCSGGIKLQLEDIEQRLTLLSRPFCLTAVPDASLGERLVLLYEGEEEAAPLIEATCRQQLERYEVPKAYLAVPHLPQTETGKPARAEARQWALRYLHG